MRATPLATILSTCAIMLLTTSMASAETLNQLEAKCARNIKSACSMLGVRYQYGIKNTQKNYSKAMSYYKKACNLGSMDSCGGVGNLYKKGLGVPVNYKLAYKNLLKACNANSSLSCDDLAHLYEKGLGVKKNKSVARMYYAKACSGTYKNACISLGVYHQYGLGGLSKSLPMAMKNYRIACNKRGGEGCYLLAKMYERGIGVAPNKSEATRLYTRGCKLKYQKACSASSASATGTFDASNDASAAEARLLGKTPPRTSNTAFSHAYTRKCAQNDVKSCAFAGIYFQSGKKGFPKDHVQSVKYYKRACDLGSKTGCGGLGYMYKQGLGTPKNYPLAIKYLAKGCNRNDALSCHDLGKMHEKGFGTPKNYKKARMKYQQACKGTYKKACVNVGVYHQYGLGGLKKNNKRAAGFYRTGCTAKSGEGCYLLGKLYRAGTGVKQDNAMATSLFRKGCALKFTKACNL